MISGVTYRRRVPFPTFEQQRVNGPSSFCIPYTLSVVVVSSIGERWRGNKQDSSGIDLSFIAAFLKAATTIITRSIAFAGRSFWCASPPLPPFDVLAVGVLSSTHM